MTPVTMVLSNLVLGIAVFVLWRAWTRRSRDAYVLRRSRAIVHPDDSDLASAVVVTDPAEVVRELVKRAAASQWVDASVAREMAMQSPPLSRRERFAERLRRFDGVWGGEEPPVTLADLVRATIPMFTERAVFFVDSREPYVCGADAADLAIVVREVLDAATRHARGNGGVVSVLIRPDELRVTAGRRGDENGNVGNEGRQRRNEKEEGAAIGRAAGERAGWAVTSASEDDGVMCVARRKMRDEGHGQWAQSRPLTGDVGR